MSVDPVTAESRWRRLAQHPRAWAGVAASLIAIGLWSPAWLRLHATGFGDWQMIHHNWEVGFVALSRFHEWPLWNPFFCGGITAFGNPETQWFSPLTWIALITGTTIGTKIFLTLHAAIGLLGMYTFGRDELRLRNTAAWLGALAWGCSGFFAWHGAGGHGTFLPFYFAPWLLICLRRAVSVRQGAGDQRYAIALAVLLALTLYEGGTYPFPYFALWLAVDALSRAPHWLTSRARSTQLALTALISGGLCLLLGAVRLLPIRDALSRLPRDTVSDDALQLTELIELLTARDHPWRFPPHRFVWPEYGTFVGWSVLVLAALGLLIAWRRHERWLLAGLAVFTWLVLGEGGPWTWLHALPVFDSLRVPSRFMVLVTFYVALLSALGLDALLAWIEQAIARRSADRTLASTRMRWLPHAIGLCVLWIAGTDLFVVNLRTIDRWDGPPRTEQAPAPRFHLTRGGGHYASLPARHLGTAGCYNGGMNWLVSPALWARDVPQVRIVPSTAGELLAFERTVNTLTLRVRMTPEAASAGPVRLLINQNYDPDFVVESGANVQVVQERGLLALDVPVMAQNARRVPAEQTITLRYRPATLAAGLTLSALGWIAACLGGAWLTRQYAKRAVDRLG